MSDQPDCLKCQTEANDQLIPPGKFGFGHMIVCSECGNKRCPKATDHNLKCTRSNAPGQKGSSWEHYKIPEENQHE